MKPVGITGKLWRKVTPEDAELWRKMAAEDKMTLREIGRATGRDHAVISKYVTQRNKSRYKPPKRLTNLQKIITNIVMNARARSKKYGYEMDIDYHHVLRLFNEQDGCCALTGMKFSLEKSDGKSRCNPYVPSIDRIDSKLGYTKDNVRLVCWAINIALADWGESVVWNLAIGYVTVHLDYGDDECPHCSSDIER